ncbi:hypothetical protein BC828DRAFT_384913 [Blastocladiella britannica]|nr:hypothetical protein BC828DRAFT_384913 [Blastocladiella britannica]
MANLSPLLSSLSVLSPPISSVPLPSLSSSSSVIASSSIATPTATLTATTNTDTKATTTATTTTDMAGNKKPSSSSSSVPPISTSSPTPPPPISTPEVVISSTVVLTATVTQIQITPTTISTTVITVTDAQGSTTTTMVLSTLVTGPSSQQPSSSSPTAAIAASATDNGSSSPLANPWVLVFVIGVPTLTLLAVAALLVAMRARARARRHALPYRLAVDPRHSVRRATIVSTVAAPSDMGDEEYLVFPTGNGAGVAKARLLLPGTPVADGHGDDGPASSSTTLANVTYEPVPHSGPSPLDSAAHNVAPPPLEHIPMLPRRNTIPDHDHRHSHIVHDDGPWPTARVGYGEMTPVPQPFAPFPVQPHMHPAVARHLVAEGPPSHVEGNTARWDQTVASPASRRRSSVVTTGLDDGIVFSPAPAGGGGTLSFLSPAHSHPHLS